MLTNTADLIWNPNSGYSGSPPSSSVDGNINVKDAASGLPVPVACVTGTDVNLLQLTSICPAPLIFSDTSPYTSSPGETEEVSILRRSKIVILASFSLVSSVAVVVWVRSVQGILIPVYEGTIQSLTAPDSDGVFKKFLTIDSYGATFAKVVFQAPLIGEVSISVGAI